MVRLLRYAGYILLLTAFLLVVLGSLMTLINDGWQEFVWLFSPFNVANFVMMLLSVAPGLILLHVAAKLDKRSLARLAAKPKQSEDEMQWFVDSLNRNVLAEAAQQQAQPNAPSSNR